MSKESNILETSVINNMLCLFNTRLYLVLWETPAMRSTHVVFQLLQTAGTDNHRRNHVLLQQPPNGYLGYCLSYLLKKNRAFLFLYITYYLHKILFTFSNNPEKKWFAILKIQLYHHARIQKIFPGGYKFNYIYYNDFRQTNKTDNANLFL